MDSWRALVPAPIATPDEFVAWLDQVGVCSWTPLPGVDFPNLAEAMAVGDVMGSTWFWKDDLHVERRLFYGKLLAGRPAFVSMGLLPAVIAARGDIDPHTLRDQGRLPDTTVRVYDALMHHRRLPTPELRHAAGLGDRADRTAFDNGVAALSALFQICKVGITGRTRGTYGYVWGLVEDWLPDVLAGAARLRPHDAARAVAARLAALGVRLTPRQCQKLLGWDEETASAVSATSLAGQDASL